MPPFTSSRARACKDISQLECTPWMECAVSEADNCFFTLPSDDYSEAYYRLFHWEYIGANPDDLLPCLNYGFIPIKFNCPNQLYTTALNQPITNASPGNTNISMLPE